MVDENETVKVDSRWATVLEYAIFGWPAMFGIAGLLLFVPLGDVNGLSKLVGSLYVVSFFGSFVLTILVTVALYFDAKRLQDADFEWNPSPALYAVGGFFFSGLVALHYLYKRYQYVTPPKTLGSWWYGVGVGFAVLLLVPAATFLLIPTGTLLTRAIEAGLQLFMMSFLVCGFLSIAIYKDAVHVRGTESDWLPNPVNYFLGVFFTMILVVVPVLVTGYYLFKRHRHVGTP